MSTYEIVDVPEYFQPILERIEELLNAWVIVDDYDEEWVHFHVPDIVDRYAIVAIEKNNKKILLGDERKEFQILCPYSNSSGEGLWLHYLCDPVTQGEYRAGAWFFGS